jgi:hypothetical protein
VEWRKGERQETGHAGRRRDVDVGGWEERGETERKMGRDPEGQEDGREQQESQRVEGNRTKSQRFKEGGA